MLVGLALAQAVAACRPAERPALEEPERSGSGRRFAEPGSDYERTDGAVTGGASGVPEAAGGAPGAGVAGRPALERCEPAESAPESSGPPAGRPPQTVECVVTGSGAALLVKGDVVVPWGLVEQGAVRVAQNGRIECVGCGCSELDARVVSCPGAVVTPGLLNLHDHIGYAATPPLPDTGERYEHRHQWRLGLEGHAAVAYEGGASAAEVVAHELRMVMSGVTGGVSAGGRRGLMRNLDSDEQSGLGYAGIVAETFPLADSSGTAPNGVCGFSSRHDDESSVEGARAYVPHLGEGIDALARSELACSADASFGLLSGRTAVVHAVGVTAFEAEILAESGAHVVWSPRSNVALYGNTAPIPLLRRLGVPIALGTDWLASGSMNLLRELACARELSRTHFDDLFTARDLLDMVTREAALALGLERALGALRPGLFGDLALFARAPGEDAAEAVVLAEPSEVLLVVSAGRPLYGEAALVAALVGPEPSGCDPFEVCGSSKRACVERETGLTLAAVRAAGEAVHPLAQCGFDAAEPSCAPSRPGEYAGPRDGDADGDGVEDAEDGCPASFDPIRPLDAGRQADADADGQGDVCDPCPLDPEQACPPIPADDLDADGIPNSVDVCVRLADPEQRDVDADGYGDACDSCPQPNPGFTPCVLPITALRDPADPRRPPEGSPVEIEGFVTALRPGGGFFLEQAAAEYAGIGVYASEPVSGVGLGQSVRITAYTQRYQGTDELLAPTLIGPAAGIPTLSPLAVEDPASIGDGGALSAAYEGLLLTLASTAVEASNADAPDDYDETLLAGGLRLDDALFPELDNLFAPGTQLELSGILGRSHGHYKLWPRSAADVRSK